MEKIKKAKYIEDIHRWNVYSDETIVDMIAELNRLQSIGATHVSFNVSDNYLNVEVYKYVEETDAEYKQRLIDEQKRLEKEKAQELLILKRLKEKYEQ